MAGHEAWWLKKNSLQPATGFADAFRDRGILATLPHQQQAVSAAPDHAKQELFGGGRRQRAQSLDEAPFGERFQRRESAPLSSRSSEHLTHNYPLSKLGMSKPPPLGVVNESSWRMGDDLPLSLGDQPPKPMAPRQGVNASDWRLGDTQSMAVILSGAPPSARPAAAPAVYNTEWRKPDMQPLSIAPDDASSVRAQHHVKPTGRLDNRWRQGSTSPLELADNAGGGAPTAARARRLSVDSVDEVNKSVWRMGDEMPFRFDGGQAERAPPTASLAGSEWRLGDAKPFSLNGFIPSVQQPSGGRGGSFGGGDAESKTTRDRRISRENDEMRQTISEVPPLGDREQRLRKGERYW